MNDKQAMNYARQLSDFDASVRRFAVKKLIEFANPLAIPYLIGILDDSDIFVKTNAEDALFQIGRESIPSVLEALESNNSEVRLRALSVYRRFGTTEKLHKIIPLLSDSDTDVKNLTITLLQKELTSASSKKIWELVKKQSTDDNLRDICIGLLMKNIVGIENEIIADFKNSRLDEQSLIIGSKLLIKLKPEGDEIFLDHINSKIPEMRIASLISLSNFQSENILSLAVAATKDENSDVRKAAVSIIGKVGGEEELQLLKELMSNPSIGVWQISKRAIEAIESRI